MLSYSATTSMQPRECAGMINARLRRHDVSLATPLFINARALLTKTALRDCGNRHGSIVASFLLQRDRSAEEDAPRHAAKGRARECLRQQEASRSATSWWPANLTWSLSSVLVLIHSFVINKIKILYNQT